MSWNVCQFPECESYTARPDGTYCETHRHDLAKQKKDEIKFKAKFKAKLSTPFVPRKAPKKVSEKRKEQNKEYSKLREQYLKDHPECEIKLQVCTRTSTQIHHTASGTNKATNLNNVATWKASCDMCNQFLHDKLSAKEAREKGLKI